MRESDSVSAKLALFHGLTFCVKFDAIQFMQTTGENLPHKSVFCGKAGTFLTCTSMGKVTLLRSGYTQYPFRACVIQTVIHSGAVKVYFPHTFFFKLKTTFFIFSKNLFFFLKTL